MAVVNDRIPNRLTYHKISTDSKIVQEFTALSTRQYYNGQAITIDTAGNAVPASVAGDLIVGVSLQDSNPAEKATVIVQLLQDTDTVKITSLNNLSPANIGDQFAVIPDASDPTGLGYVATYNPGGQFRLLKILSAKQGEFEFFPKRA